LADYHPCAKDGVVLQVV